METVKYIYDESIILPIPCVIKTNTTIRPVYRDKDKFDDLKEIYDLIDVECIEIITLRNMKSKKKVLMILDEEGKLKNSPFNVVASFLAKDTVALNDFICGNVLLCFEDQI